MNINSYCPVQLVSGKGCVINNSYLLKNIGSRCLIITGGSSAEKSGAIKDVVAALKKEGIEYSVFNKITQNPYTADCHAAGEAARSFNAGFIFGIGGGSVLDASKAAAIYASNANLKPHDIYLRKYDNKPLPVVLLGTTAGTGSEVTGVSVLTDSESGMKKSVSGHDCYSVLSFCDYSYTQTVPYDFTVSTALDAFAHATESFFSASSNDLSDVYALKAFEMLSEPLRFLNSTHSLPNEQMRETLYIASLYAGLCLNITGTCFPHTMGYVLTEDFHIPHGRACAAFTPDFLLSANRCMKNKAAMMCAVMAMTFDEIIALIRNLANISIKITDEQIEKYAKRWSVPLKNFDRSPENFTGKDAAQIIKKIGSSDFAN